MRKFYLFIFRLSILIFTGLSFGQDCMEWRIKDEFQLEHIHGNIHFQQHLDSLTNIGYYALQILETNEDSCLIMIQKGKQFKKIFIVSDDDNLLLSLPFDKQHQLHYTENFNFLIQELKDSLKQHGQHFDEININPKSYRNGNAMVEIKIEKAPQRKINDIKFMGYENVPKFVKKSLLNRDLIYNDENLSLIKRELDQFRFLQQTETPRISFTKDSTLLYVYTQKIKQSYINGIIGFETDENNKLNLQGNVQLNLLNTFNGNERIRLDWKSGLNKSQNLSFETFLPYIFNFKLALESQLNLIKQDSSFFKIEWRNSVLYPIKNNHYIGGSFNLASSNYINKNSDFSKSGFGINYSYENARVHQLQENKSFIHFSSTLWKRKIGDAESAKDDQTEVRYRVERQQKIYKNHYLHAAFFGRNLIQKGEVLENDMYQVGGFNNLRGFNQNSILTPGFNTLSLAYRYIPNNRIFFEAITDLALIQSMESNESTFFNAYGLGMQFATNFGWFQLHYAIGSQEGSSADFSDGKIHIGIKSYF